MVQEYKEFLEAKIVVAESYGKKIKKSLINPILLPHQKDIVHWSLCGGRRAIFASFGLGKTVMQLEIAVQVMKITRKPFLICMPLGVVGEFRDDLKLLKPADIRDLFHKSNMETYFDEGLLPKDAVEEELRIWAENR